MYYRLDVYRFEMEEVNGTNASGYAHDGFPPTYVLYVGSVCVFAGIVRLLSRWTVVHHTVIMFGLGALFGYLSRVFEGVHRYVNLGFLTSAKLLQVHTLLLPVIILEYLFSMDPRVFLSCSPLAVITVMLDYSLTLLIQGAFIFYFLDMYDLPTSTVKTVLIYLLFGSLTSVTDTSYVVNTFYKMGSYWILVKLLEMKRVISLVGACVVYIFVVYVNEFNYEIGWHNIVIFIVLQFVVSPALGWLTAQIMVFWLGRLYNDIGVEITVSIAVAYLLYYFGTVNIADKPMVSAIAVVVYALLLNNRRTCFSLGLDVFLTKLSSILAYVVKTVIFTIAGYIIANQDMSAFDHPYSTFFFPHLLISLTLYSWCMLSRGLVCVILAPALRRCGYPLSWQELSTMAFCNVTGTVCLITAVASCNAGLVDLFYGDRHIQYMLMFHLGVLAVIRSLVAGTMFRHVLMVLGMRHVSLGRYVAMNNALQKVQEQTRSSARSYKFDRFLADADWDTVFEFTNFDEPYKDISRYSVIGRAMDLNPDLLGDLRLNMLHAERMSFWRQYEQGLLSLRALRILLEECYLAEWNVTTSGYDIGDQIRKHYQIKKRGMFNALQIMKEKFEHIQDTRRLLIAEVKLSAKSKWKKLVFKVGLHVSLEIILIVAVVVTSIVSIFVLVYESICPEGWYMQTFTTLYVHLDIAFMVFYTVYITLKLYIFRWRYLVLFGSFFNISLLIVGWLDVILHDADVLLRPKEFCEMLDETQWAVTYHLFPEKFFVVYRCLRLFILFEDKTYFFSHTMKKTMLLRLQLGYDVGKAYVYCKEEIVRTAGEFISESRTLEDIRKELQTTRVQLMRELATVQKKYPGIVVSVKSQEACRRILHVAKETINQLQRNGRVDSYEAQMLDEMVKLRLKRLNQIPAQIELPSVDTLISKLSWVGGDESLMTFLHFNSKLFNMAEGESVDFDCDPTAGLYVLVSGLIRVNWSIGEPYGRLKQSSHVQSETSLHSVDTVNLQLHDYMTTGSTFGELALLTETPVVIDAVCETTVLMYHIQYESVRTALDWVTEPPLEWRLWLIAAVRLSVPLLKALPAHYNSSLEDVKVLTDSGTLIVQRLESQFSDDSNEEKFNLTRHASSHVILIHGTASKSNETYTGPVIIPPDNDDLVFSSVYCDRYVLYIVPHRTIASGTGAFAAPVASLTPSELSTVVELPKETPGHAAAAARTLALKKRGRAMSIAGAGAAVASSPLRFVDEESTVDREKESGSESDKKTQLTLPEVPELEEGSLKSDPLLYLQPVPVKPAITPESPVEYHSPLLITPSKPDETTESVESVKSVESVAPVEAVKEEVTEPPASPPKPMAVSEAVAQDEPVEAKTEEASTASRESSPVGMLPRKSASENIVRPHPWTEAWKYVLPLLKPTLTLGRPSQTRTASTNTPAPAAATRLRDAAAQTVGPADGREDAGIRPTSAPRQVTDASTTRPPEDVNEENKNVNSSVNNNSSNNNIDNNELYLSSRESEVKTSIHRMRSKDATVVPVPRQFQSLGQFSRSSEFRLGEGSKDETAAGDRLPHAASSARTGERSKIPRGPGNVASYSPTIVTDEVALKLLERSNVPTPGGLVLDDNDDVINSGLFPSDTAANNSTSPTSRDRDSWILDLRMQSRSVTASYTATRKDLNEDSPTLYVSDKSQTVFRTSEVPPGKVATESKRAVVAAATGELGNVVPDSRVVNSAAMKRHYGSEQYTPAKAANVKSDVSKTGLPDTMTAGKTAVDWTRQRTKTLGTMPDSGRNVRAADTLYPNAPQHSETARSDAASCNISGRASPRGENCSIQLVPRRPSSSRPEVADADAENRNRGVRRVISAGGKEAAKSDSRQKISEITDDGRASRVPAGSTTSAQMDVSSEDADEDQSAN